MLSQTTKGYIAGYTASIVYGLIPLFTLPLYAEGMNPDSVLLFRFLFTLPVLGAFCVTRKCKFEKLSLKQHVYTAVFGIFMGLSALFLFLGFKNMDVGIVSTIFFVYPIMIAAIMTIFLRERISPVTLFCIILATAGIALLYNPAGESGRNVSDLGFIYAILSALSYAIYIVGVNRPTLKSIHSLPLTLYMMGYSCLLFGARIVISDNLVMPQNASMWINLFLLSSITTALAFLCTTIASHYIGPTITALLGAIKPVVAVIVGVCIFDELFTMREGLGLTIIVVSVMLVIVRDKVTNIIPKKNILRLQR